MSEEEPNNFGHAQDPGAQEMSEEEEKYELSLSMHGIFEHQNVNQSDSHTEGEEEKDQVPDLDQNREALSNIGDKFHSSDSLKLSSIDPPNRISDG